MDEYTCLGLLPYCTNAGWPFLFQKRETATWHQMALEYWEKQKAALAKPLFMPR